MKKFLLFLTIFLLLTSNVFAWSSHGELTRIVLYDSEFLQKFDNITITEYKYQDIDTELYNPDFKIEYKEGDIGDKTTALEILSIYADEPDWEMDENLKLSPFQKITGGSSGWRHQYFITLFGLIRLGKAPDRAEYFYNLALEAFKKEDYYWGFRFFARSLHYIEDVTQPLHTFPLPYSIVIKNIFNLDGLIQIGKNHHYTLEDYQEAQLGRGDYIDALKSAKPIEIKNIKKTGISLAMNARKYSGRIFKIQEKFYGKDISKKEEFKINKDDYRNYSEDEVRNEYDELIIENLKNLSSVVLGMVNKLQEDLKTLNIIE